MYQFIIPNKKIVTYQVFAYGIIILNLLGLFLAQPFTGTKTFNIAPAAIAVVLIIIWDVYRYKKKGTLQSIGMLILIGGIFWLSMGYTYLLLLDIFLWVLYMISKRRMVIAADTSRVMYPSFPEKKVAWQDISNIVLKDDVLTIDMKNNKIYQHLIEYADKEINEAEFNDFCRKQLMVNGQ
ncbi:MAG TPA: EbsA family protein [Niabella sp.]|nr:EbsA family protein [Niabella sp.]